MSEVYYLSIGMAIFLSCVGVGFLFGVMSFVPSKSQKYRKYLANMYVASKVRTLAKEDDLDLDIEGLLFKKYERKIDRKDKDLDKTIEEDLKERIEEAYDKEKPKK